MRHLSILFLIITLFSCQSTSYYAAQNTNQKRFGGWEKEDADFLVDAHDKAMLAEALSNQAEEIANLRQVYVLAKDTQDEMENLEIKFKLEASIQRIKLASALSEKSDEYVQKLSDISKDNFDAVFLQYYMKSLTDLMSLCDDYIKEGHSERLVEFAEEVKDLFEPYMERAKSVELS